jgi:ABC-type branched-subunit amino acid transport system ATPase component
MEATIEVSGLRKHFGPTVALDGMTFTVQPGKVTGFVGPNGRGQIHDDAGHPRPGRDRRGQAR